MSMEAVKEMVGYAGYTAYKGSGEEWLGEIPQTWTVQKLKFLGGLYAGLTDKKGADFSKESMPGFKPFIPFTNIYRNRVISPSEYQYVRVADGERQNQVNRGDILFLMSSETLEDIGKCALVWDDAAPVYLNSFCKGFRPASPLVRSEYLNYLLAAPAYRTYFSLVGRGFTRMNIKQEYVGSLPIVLPSVPEQTRIAAFLDRKCGQIDAAIAQKERLIALLKERRQVLVQQAVTKGLDPQVKMKDSGVPWLGEVPEHWEVKKSKRLFGQRKERARKGDEQLTASQKHGVIPQKLFMELEGRRVTQVMLNADILKHVEADDFVISMRSFQGGIEHSAYSGCISSAYIPLVPLRHVVTDYFKYLLKCPSYITALAGTSDLVRDGQAMRYENFCAIDLIIVPEAEQIEIANYLKAMDERTDKSLALQEAQIAKLKEYRSILINAAVTGKIKVPEE